MNELLVLLGFIAICIAVAFAFSYLILKITSYFKSRYHCSMGPCIITMCLSLDLLVIASLLHENHGDTNSIQLFMGAACLLACYAIVRDIINYKMMALAALPFQLLISLLQLLMVTFAIAVYLFRKFMRKQDATLNSAISWLRYIWNI